jgi:hypothetical protein
MGKARLHREGGPRGLGLESLIQTPLDLIAAPCHPGKRLRLSGVFRP